MSEHLSNSEDLVKKINNYLYYGYFIPDEIPSFLTQLKEYDYYEPNVKNTATLFQKVFNESINSTTGSGYCIIPISGGWDSRILLGYALETLPASQIKTYTFGTKGQLDFDLGKQLARKAGVEHVQFDLSQIKLSWDKLKVSVVKTPWTYTIDAFFNKHCYTQMSSNADFVLSGFMGDPLTGGHVYQSNIADVKEHFAKSQMITAHTHSEENNFIPADALPKLPKNTLFSQHQLLDLGVRQSHCIAPIVSYNKSWDSWEPSLGNIPGTNTNIITPFAHPKWISFWLNVPDYLKNERRLYLDFLQNKFPELAGIPSKDFYGAKKNTGISKYLKRKRYHAKILINRQYPHLFSEPKEMLNYLDFDQAFRNREDYKEVLNRAITLLKDNEIVEWLNLNKLQSEHMSYSHNHSKTFLLLIGLALNLEVQERL